MEWQPIETAPKDGSEILIARAGDCVDLAYWVGEMDKAWPWAVNGGQTAMAADWPTHWMLLPDPPVAECA